MKGYGIMFIALHNLLHVERFTGFIKENENSFDVQRTLDFFNVLNMCDWSIFGQFFSFLGWIGVPVFIFVSGYGLVKKHEKDNQSFVVKDYILHNWKKLALLLLPGLLFYIVLSFPAGTWQATIPRSIFQLTLLNNFLMPPINVHPGVYWYFGMVFELYLLYVIVRSWNIKSLLILLTSLILIQVISIAFLTQNISPFGCNSEFLWTWLRHNFFGWGHIFLTGMIVAKINNNKCFTQTTIVYVIVGALSLILLPFLQLNVWLWLLFVPFVALLFFVALANAFNNIPPLKKIGLWLGNYSAFIFVVHPIVRTIIGHIQDAVSLPLWLFTILYIFFFLIAAIPYKILYKKLNTISLSKES